MIDDPNFPRIEGESDQDYEMRLAKTQTQTQTGPSPSPTPSPIISPPIANAQVTNRRQGGGMSGTAATAGKAAASSSSAGLGVILLNSYLARHGMEPMGVDESIAIGGLMTAVVHVIVAILAAIGNKVAQKLGLTITFPVYVSGAPQSTREVSPS